MSIDKIKQEYRDALAKAVAGRDAAISAAGEDEAAKKAAIAAFDEWDFDMRAVRDNAAQSIQESSE